MIRTAKRCLSLPFSQRECNGCEDYKKCVELRVKLLWDIDREMAGIYNEGESTVENH